jgi:hypothetical protein
MGWMGSTSSEGYEEFEKFDKFDEVERFESRDTLIAVESGPERPAQNGPGQRPGCGLMRCVLRVRYKNVAGATRIPVSHSLANPAGVSMPRTATVLGDKVSFLTSSWRRARRSDVYSVGIAEW